MEQPQQNLNFVVFDRFIIVIKFNKEIPANTLSGNTKLYRLKLGLFNRY